VRATLTIEHLSPEGDGIGRVEGREVTVPGLFDGEHAEVQLVHRSRQRAADVARSLRIVEPHPSRRRAPCERHASRDGRCGGCALMELDEAAQRESKRRMLQALGLDVGELIGTGPALGYRMSSKRVAFMRENGALALGSWARGTHAGADMDGCLVDHPKIASAASEIARAANALGVEAYDEARGTGDLRYVWLKTDGERVAVTLVTASEDSRAVRLLPSRLAVGGIAHSVQPARTNAMRGSEARWIAGSPDLGALGFSQPNPEVIARTYDDLVKDEHGVPYAGALAWDLYAGSGATTERLRARFEGVVPCESYPESAARLGVAAREVIPFLKEHDTRPDLVVANPPRKGLGAEVARLLASVRAPRVAIMSCGPEGLARDLALLEAAGYRRAAIAAYDSLPQTPHVELVAKLRAE
jgi:23S rRNA (uracil1939-C5)-methyltransferase